MIPDHINPEKIRDFGHRQEGVVWKILALMMDGTEEEIGMVFSEEAADERLQELVGELWERVESED